VKEVNMFRKLRLPAMVLAAASLLTPVAALAEHREHHHHRVGVYFGYGPRPYPYPYGYYDRWGYWHPYAYGYYYR
jgi:hypothetical protein